MSRRGRSIRSASAFFVAAAAALMFAGPAAADPVPSGTTDVARSDLSPVALHAAAVALGPDASAAVEQLLHTAVLPELGLTVPKPFMYPAPTLGCGAPATLTLASAQSGPNFPIPPWVNNGDLRFQAIPGFVDLPVKSNLSVAYINLATFKGGIVPLDETLLDVPTLSKTVVTGKGPVLAALWGGVTYASGATCFALPTVGSFTA